MYMIKTYCYLFHSQLDFTIVKLTDAKLKDVDTSQLLDIEPINFSKPADIKNMDQIYVIQYPHNGSLSLSASSCCLKGMYVKTAFPFEAKEDAYVHIIKFVPTYYYSFT